MKAKIEYADFPENNKFMYVYIFLNRYDMHMRASLLNYKYYLEEDYLNGHIGSTTKIRKFNSYLNLIRWIIKPTHHRFK